MVVCASDRQAILSWGDWIMYIQVVEHLGALVFDAKPCLAGVVTWVSALQECLVLWLRNAMHFRADDRAFWSTAARVASIGRQEAFTWGMNDRVVETGTAIALIRCANDVVRGDTAASIAAIRRRKSLSDVVYDVVIGAKAVAWSAGTTCALHLTFCTLA